MDKYDKAVQYLTEHPEAIYDAWDTATASTSLQQYPIASCLFRAITPDGESYQPGNSCCGCLTQVKYEDYRAFSGKLTQEIRADDRIPEPEDITLEHLPIFAEWQRRVDVELNRPV